MTLKSSVTESKLPLLTALLLRDEALGQGVATLFGKPVDREGGRLVSQRTIFPESEFRLFFFILREGGMVKTNISWSWPDSGEDVFISSCSHSQVDLVRMFPGS